MKKMEFIQEPSKLEKFLESKQVCYMNPFLFMVDGEIVLRGEATMEDNEVCIEHVESLQPRKGFGRLLIQHLFQDVGVKEVYGESVPDAFDFWKKVGAEFEPTALKEFESSTEFEEDFLIPFTIYPPPINREAV